MWWKVYLCPCLIKKEDDEGEMVIVSYSSGDSNASDVQESDEERGPYNELDNLGKEDRMLYLWQRCYAKIRGAVLVIIRFGDLEKRINLFGTSMKFEFILQEDPIPACYIIMPDSIVKMIWSIIMIFLLFYTATFVPFRTAFIDDVSKEFEYFEYVVDFLFLMDLFINFVSAYVDADRKKETRVKIIAINYIKTWFFLDLLACIPFQLFTGNFELLD